MATKPTRSFLKKQFLSGLLSIEEFKEQLVFTYRYRGFYIQPGKKPKWSGPYRNTIEEAERDNAPYWDKGYAVDIYIEQG